MILVGSTLWWPTPESAAEQKPTAEYSDDSWHKVIGVNLDGVFYTQREGIKAMKTHRWR